MDAVVHFFQPLDLHPVVDHFTVALLIVGVLTDLVASLFPLRNWIRYMALTLMILGFALMIWFAGLYPRAKHLRLAGALLFLGIALDVLQGVATTTRTFDLFDIQADAVGIAVALALAYWLLEGWCQRLERFTIRSA